jgi:hypothetical protein
MLKKFGSELALGGVLKSTVLTVGAILLALSFLNGIASKQGDVRFPTAEEDIQVMSAVREEMAKEYGEDWLITLMCLNRTNGHAAVEMFNTFSNLCTQAYIGPGRRAKYPFFQQTP